MFSFFPSFSLSLSLSPSKSLFGMCAPSHTKKIQKRRLENGGGGFILTAKVWLQKRELPFWRHDTQNNDTPINDTRRNINETSL
jgi:hypothetical protein